MDEAFEEIKRVESAEPEDFEEMLDDFNVAINWLNAPERDFADTDQCPYVSRDEAATGVRNARAAIRGYVSQLQSENDALREQFYDLQQDSSDNNLALRSQLSRLQQTGLTAEEAVMCLMDMEQIPRDDDEGNTHWSFTIWKAAVAKLKALAALRSLEGDRGK